MARTSKNAKAVTVATVAEAATDAEIRDGVETADVAALPPAAEPETGTVADAAGVAAEGTSVPGPDAAAEPEPVAIPANGETVFVPLNKLKKSPRNARKTPHTETEIEAYAASIAAKGMFQNLVVEPELDGEGKPTGFYFVSIGEGRRLAQLLRAKRKEIKKTEPIRCVIDTANDPFEISLDENVTRAAMHPADQFEAFRDLAQNRGLSAADIGARFGISAHVVKQRLKLGAVSPRLMQVYHDGELTLEQLQAFAITDDHARQEQVYKNLSYNREPWIIRRELTANNVAATDRRAIFVGPEDYLENGGTIIRDLFTEDRGGFYEDAALLDRLVIGKLEWIAQSVQEAEGWKWVDVHIDYPHGNGMRRTYPQPVELSKEDAAAYDAAQEELERLSAEWEDADVDLPPDVDERFAELEAEIERIDALRHTYDPDDIARGGVFVVLSPDGEARIERGFIRPEDEAPEPDEPETDVDGESVIDGVRVNEDGEVIEDGFSPDPDSDDDEDAEEDGKPLSDLLIRDLTAHRTLGLRLALGEQPDMALIAVTHTLAAQTFYRGADANALEIRPISADLDGHAVGIEDTEAAKLFSDRHAGWAQDMPQDVADLWDFVAGLDQASVMALFAHCALLTVNALKLPWEHKHRAYEAADRLATAVGLDMTAHWTPTVRTYFGRVTKAHIVAAVREAVGDEAADRIAGKKKQEMAEAAEQLLAGTGWLPPLLRTKPPTEADAVAGAQEGAEPDTPEPAAPDLDAEAAADPEADPVSPNPDAEDGGAEADEPPPDPLDPDAQETDDPEEAPVSPDPDAEDGGADMDGEAFHEAAE